MNPSKFFICYIKKHFIKSFTQERGIIGGVEEYPYQNNRHIVGFLFALFIPNVNCCQKKS
jgi:hypothetical protein